MDEMQNNEAIEAIRNAEPKGPAPGNLLTVIPGIILCIVTVLFVFLMAIGSDLLLPQEQRDQIQEKLNLYEITEIFSEAQNKGD